MPGSSLSAAGSLLLGSGDSDLEAGFAAAAAAHPGRVGVALGYDEALSHLILAGGDAIVMPSRFEPCGLTQLYALRYGALPVVRRTGGLADTVVDANAATLAAGTATGFAFDAETPEALLAAIQRAIALYRDRAHLAAHDAPGDDPRFQLGRRRAGVSGAVPGFAACRSLTEEAVFIPSPPVRTAPIRSGRATHETAAYGR